MSKQYLNSTVDERHALLSKVRAPDNNMQISNKEVAKVFEIDPHYDVNDLTLDELDPSHPALFVADTMWGQFERLRKEDPVHYHETSMFGPYWSVTKYKDIMYVDSHHEEFSSQPTIVIGDPGMDFIPPQFIAMDPPKHDVQRAAVTPAVAPGQ